MSVPPYIKHGAGQREKHAAVRAHLAHPEWSAQANGVIALYCDVDTALVRRLRAQMAAPEGILEDA